MQIMVLDCGGSVIVVYSSFICPSLHNGIFSWILPLKPYYLDQKQQGLIYVAERDFCFVEATPRNLIGNGECEGEGN